MATQAKRLELDSEVVDCDFHLTEKQSDLVPYLDDPWQSMLKDGNETNVQSGGGKFYPTSGYLSTIQVGKAEDNPMRSPEDVYRGMDLVNSDRVILTPGLNLSLSLMHHDDLAVAFASAYNRYVLDNFLDEDPNFYGSGIVASQKPEKAAEEIYRIADESGIVGIFVAIGGVTPLLGNEIYDPIYEACEDVGLPLVFHNSVSSTVQSFPTKHKGSSRYIVPHTAVHAADYLFHLSSIVFRGVPVRYPDLKFVIQESGIGWIPYFMRRLDDEYSKRRHDAPLLEKAPSEYVDDQFFFTSQPIEGQDDPTYINNMIRMFNGTENLMFSSDFPHFDFDHPSWFLDTLRQEFEPDEIANIYGETALDVYGF